MKTAEQLKHYDVLGVEGCDERGNERLFTLRGDETFVETINGFCGDGSDDWIVFGVGIQEVVDYLLEHKLVKVDAARSSLLNQHEEDSQEKWEEFYEWLERVEKERSKK